MKNSFFTVIIYLHGIIYILVKTNGNNQINKERDSHDKKAETQRGKLLPFCLSSLNNFPTSASKEGGG